MGHMPSFSGCGGGGSHMDPLPDTDCGGSCGCTRVVTYVATGLEGTDFRVPIGLTLALDTYELGLLGIAGAANLPVCDFPQGAGDRTIDDFRVLTAAPLGAGDRLKFLLLE